MVFTSRSGLSAHNALSILRTASLQPNGVASGGRVSAPGQALAETADIATIAKVSSQGQAKISNSLFDRSVPDVQEMKINLMRRLGHELGVSFDELTPKEFAASIRKEIALIKASPFGSSALRELEHKLGLDKLGISIDTLVNAISNPDGDDNKTLTDALEAQLGQSKGDVEKKTAEAGSLLALVDEAGLYDRVR